MDISLFLDQIQASSRYENQIVHNEKIPAREALYAPLELKEQNNAIPILITITHINRTFWYDPPVSS